MLTATHFECQAITVLTANTIQDTGAIEDILLIDEDVIDNQARCLLEDIQIQAIRASGLYCADHASVIAQVAADYDNVPLILHLGPQYPSAIDGNTDDELEALMAATWETLIPQAGCVVVDCNYLNHWTPEDEGDHADPVPVLLEAVLAAGAKSCLALFCPTADDLHQHMLLEAGGHSRAFGFFPQAGQPETGDLISAALASLLARRQPLADACEQAIIYSHKALAAGRKLGMSKLVAKRL